MEAADFIKCCPQYINVKIITIIVSAGVGSPDPGEPVLRFSILPGLWRTTPDLRRTVTHQVGWNTLLGTCTAGSGPPNPSTSVINLHEVLIPRYSSAEGAPRQPLGIPLCHAVLFPSHPGARLLCRNCWVKYRIKSTIPNYSPGGQIVSRVLQTDSILTQTQLWKITNFA